MFSVIPAKNCARLLACVLASGFGSRAIAATAAVADFALMDQNGKLMELSRQKTAKALVFIAYDSHCAAVRANAALVNQWREKYGALGVRFYYIDPGTADRAHAMNAAKALGLQLPILMDDTQEIARGLGFAEAGDVLIVSTAPMQIIFRGSLSSQALSRATATALEHHLSAQPLEPIPRPDLTCPIAYLKRPAVTYTQTIQPIIADKCGGCHFERKVAPAGLFTYRDLVGWGKMLREVIMTERMPPWETDSFYTPLEHEVALNTKEKKAIYSWIANGFPRGPDQPPRAARRKPKAKLNADLRLAMKSEIQLPAQSATPWYYEEVMSNVPEDIWISAYEMNFSNRSIIQHANILVANRPLDLKKNLFQPEFDDPSILYNMLWWHLQLTGPKVCKKGFAYKIPKGSYVYFELHLSPTGKPERELVSANLQKFSENGGPPREWKYWAMRLNEIDLPAQTRSKILSVSQPMDRDFYIDLLSAHMHLRGNSARLSEVLPGGQEKIIFSERYLFKVKRGYELRRPYLVKAGSVLKAEFEYDNSADNPADIDFTRNVHRGVNLSEEMGMMHIWGYYARDAGVLTPSKRSTVSSSKTKM